MHSVGNSSTLKSEAMLIRVEKKACSYSGK